jgi:hypothetical protein
MVEISDRWLYLYRKGEGCRVLCMLARIDSERGAKRARERQVFLSLINREWWLVAVRFWSAWNRRPFWWLWWSFCNIDHWSSITSIQLHPHWLDGCNGRRTAGCDLAGLLFSLILFFVHSAYQKQARSNRRAGGSCPFSNPSTGSSSNPINNNCIFHRHLITGFHLFLPSSPSYFHCLVAFSSFLFHIQIFSSSLSPCTIIIESYPTRSPIAKYYYTASPLSAELCVVFLACVSIETVWTSYVKLKDKKDGERKEEKKKEALLHADFPPKAPSTYHTGSSR